MGHWMHEAQTYGKGWDKLSKEVRKRDDWTCQRCLAQSGPHAGSDGRVLDVHHIVWKSRGGEDEKDNLITLCRPCHGVQHPDNENFDNHRHRANVYPSVEADERVAFVNTATESERLDDFLSRKGTGGCKRCGNLPSDDEPLVIYPRYTDASDIEGDPLGEELYSLCQPCAGIVLSNDADIRYSQLRTADGQYAEDVLTNRHDEAHISPRNPSGRFDVTRDSVNWKEWFLFESPYRHVHTLWQGYGSFIIFAILAVFVAQNIGWLVSQMNTVVPKPFGWNWYDGGYVLLLLAGVLAYTIRFSVAALTQRLWRVIDPTIEPAHFEKQVWLECTGNVVALLYLVGGPFVLLVVGLYILATLSAIGLELLA